MTDLVTQIVRGPLIGGAGLLLGMSALVLWKYRQPVTAGSLVTTHVMTIATSYCLLIVMTAATQLERLVDDAGPSWRLLVLPIAYLLGIWGLRLLLLDVAKRHRRGQLNRQTDPKL